MQALVVIDMQMEMQHRISSGREHVNPDAPDRIAQLLAVFRRRGFLFYTSGTLTKTHNHRFILALLGMLLCRVLKLLPPNLFL